MIGISENAVLASCAALRTDSDIVTIAGDPGKMNRLTQFKTGNARVASPASNTFCKLLYIQYAFRLHPQTISVKSARKEVTFISLRLHGKYTS